ncbi:MAG: NADH-quinone oxidoreductase subunit M [Polyangiaceae bacterium]|jgi:NADH-quinone oxidoreductase subunit M|nr:NADH-quinone oxidoreductase subunit M [Polyangiaceae bacterium]
MNPSTFSLLDLWPALAAGAVGALMPSQRNPRLRLGLGLVGALLVFFLLQVWASPKLNPEQPAEEWPHLLNVLIAVPLLGALWILFMPRQATRTLQGFTLAALGVDLLLSLKLLSVPMSKGWHFQYIKDWLPELGIRYHVAIDGISLWLVVLTAFSTPIAAYAAFGSIKTRIKDLCFSILLMQAAMIASFVALDLFLFYLSFELMLVPMYVMIGIWGGVDKIKASIKFFLYTMFGSVLMLAAILYLVWTYSRLTGAPSFDLLALSKVMLPQKTQMLCFWAFAIAFFIKVPMFPVHTWLPDAHVQAPTAGSVILAAIMLKVGTYGYLRFAMGLFPWAARTNSANLAGVAVLGGILYGALCAWKQDDVKKLVAYSSVAHLGYVMLGLFGSTTSGIQGSILQMVNHGISTGALFLLVGVIYDRRHTRQVEEFGGLAKVMPVYTALWIIVTLASIGVPGTNGFVGEFMIIMGTYVSGALAKFGGIDAVLAAAGVILGAVYMLSVTQKMFFGPLSNPKNKHLKDINAREILALSPLIVMIFVIGLFPAVFLDRMKDAVDSFDVRYRDTFEAAKAHGNDPAALLDIKDETFTKGAPPVGKSAANTEGAK